MSPLSALRGREFPWAVRGEQVYLNHASTGPLPQRTVDALHDFTALRAQPWRISVEMQFGTLAKARVACGASACACPCAPCAWSWWECPPTGVA